MSSEIPPRRHRHTRSAAIPSTAASSQNPQNPHHLNVQTHARNNQTQANMSNTVPATQPATPPRTPRRNNQTGPQNFANSAAPETGSKQKSRNKNRPKNVMTSPAAAKKDRRTPPMAGPLSAGLPSARPINTPSATAYAGPTFHASPAPSALPIPSFYSKSVPDSPGLRGLRSLKDNPSLSTPPPVDASASAKKSQREESPLDILFNADRADRARARSAISQQSVANGPFQPPSGSPRSSQTPPASRSQTQAQTISSKRISSSGMFAMEELDGEEDSETTLGPAFSTPYSERINAARSGTQSSQFPTQSNAAHHPQNTDEVKAYLFSDFAPLSPPGTTSSNGSPYHTSSTSHGGLNRTPQRPQYNTYHTSPDSRASNVRRPSTRSSGLRQEVTPSKTPTYTPDRNNNYGQPNNSLQALRNSAGISDYDLIFGSFKSVPLPSSPSNGEGRGDLQGATDALRKILKLDAVDDSCATANGIGSLPHTNSVPNYVGGRPPPMNGMHNGVMGS